MKNAHRSYDATARDFQLWTEYVDPHGAMSEDEFDALSVDEKVNIQIQSFGPEPIRQAAGYTIAYSASSGMLIACIPDSDDIESAIAQTEDSANISIDRSDLVIERGLVLTDDDSTGEVRFRSNGNLSDSEGNYFDYAVRRAAGRPTVLKGGKRVNLYLDAASLARAEKLGDGNVSEGVRIALRQS